MRYVFSVAALAVLAMFAPSQASAQGLSVTNYRLISTERLSNTQSYYTLAADIVNTGAARSAVTATVSSPVPNLQVVPGQTNLHFTSVPAGGTIGSIDTFKLLVDTTVTPNYSQLQWTFAAPYAKAGANQTVSNGANVILNGSGSSNPSGSGYLLYSWTFLSRPPGSSARIFNSSDVIANFTADVPNATWLVQLTVTNGAGSDVSTMTVTTGNSAPTANAGPNQTVLPGATVTLNGSGSSDADGDTLTYAWTLPTRPAGSNAVISNPTSVTPTFIADRNGTYIAQLIVNDGKGHNSVPATVTITTQNTAPVANAGAPQAVSVGATVTLNGAGSTDVDGDTLTYLWSLITKPGGSAATLSSTTAIMPTFVVDVAGTYVAQLVVHDGKVSSVPATVTITTNGSLGPVANAGPNQTVKHHSLVTLSGSGQDPQSRPLTYQWSLITKPAGSTAALSSATAQNPTFTADLLGTYVAQLIVNNGVENSQPSTVTITTTNTAPVANAGSNQIAAVNSVVTLNGTFSSDSDGDAITYAWTFTAKPVGSNAILTGATSSTPTFTPDIDGVYVVQLIVSDVFANSTPATVTITAGSASLGLTPTPLNLATNAPGTMTLTLSGVAGPSGLVVTLSNSAPGVATAPASVTVPANASSVTFQVTPVSVGITQISASASGYRPATAIVNVSTPTMSVSLSATTVGISKSITGTVTLSGPAPAPGVTVNVNSSPAGVVTVSPSQVVIATGATTGTFTVTGTTAGNATVAVSAPGYTGASASVLSAAVGQISVEKNVTVSLGQTKNLTVQLASPAPVGGVVITLTSSNPSAVVVSNTVTIAGGSTAPASPATVTGVAFGSSTITASASGMTGDSSVVTVGSALTFDPGALQMSAGNVQNLTLSLSAPAPSAMTVNITSSNTSVATVPNSVVIAANATSVQVPVTSVSAGSTTITATPTVANVLPATASVTVSNLGGIQMPSTNNVAMGQTVNLQITLTSAAPTGGVTINLVNSTPSRATLSASSVFIQAGAVSPAAQPTVTGVAPGTTTITANATGFGTATQSINVTAAFTLTPTTASFPSGSTQNLTLTLSAPAPAGGLTATLSSSNTSVATVPATVSIPAGATTATVTVSGQIPGTATITASASGVTSASATMTVQNSGVILVSSTTVQPGQTAALNITLPSPAASTTTLTLVSSDPSKATLTQSTTTILAGQTKPISAPLVNGVSFGSTTITASGPGYGAGTGTVTVGAALSFNASSLTVNAGANQSVQVALSVSAPAGGVPVTLTSSNPAVLSLPGSVNIATNAGAVNFVVTALTPGTTTITASSATANITPATLTITVPGAANLGSINLASGTSVVVGQTASLPVTLSAPAPAGGTVVSLVSSDTSKVTITPATVTIAAGATTPTTQPTVTGVAAGSANITASATNYTSATQAVTVTSAGVITLTPTTASMLMNSSQNLTVTLPSAAPAGGRVVNLSTSNSSVAAVPATVTVLEGATTATVTVNSLAAGTANITASVSGQGQATSVITVTAAIGINLAANVTVSPGQTKTFGVTLSSAPTVTTTVNLSSADTAKLTISPASITFNAGSTTPVTSPTVTGIAEGTVAINASGNGLTSASQNVKVGYTLTFTPTTATIVGTGQTNLSLALSAPAPANLTVTLSSSSTATATTQPTITIPAGSSQVNVLVTGVAPGTTTITASAANISAVTATVNVVATNTIQVPQLIVTSLGKYVPFTITLPTPAGPNGVTVTITSPDLMKVIPQQPTVFVAAGQTQPASQPTLLAENVGDVNITASAPGYTAGVGMVKVGAKITWETSAVTIPAGTSQVVRFALDSPAPGVAPFPGDTGVKINFVSSNPSVVYTRPDVTAYPDGSEFTTMVLVVNAISPGVATITASGINIDPIVLTVTVPGAGGTTGSISLPTGTNIGVGQSSTFPVTLSTPAPAGGTTVSLVSNDGSKVTVAPASVYVAAGATQPTVQPTVTGVAAGTANITASGANYTSATQSVTVTSSGTITLTPTTQSILIGTTQNLTVTLPVAAGAGGKTVTLTSSNTAAATVPATVTVPQGSTTATVTVTGVAAGTTTITALSSGQGQATSAITVTAAIGINLPSNFVVAPGQTKTFPVTLSSAPTVATTVNLVSGDTAKMSISPASITFNAGSTTPTASVSVTGIAEGTVSVDASGNGLTPATTSVKVGYTLAFTPNTTTIVGTATQNLTLTLSGPAQTTLTVNVASSTPAAATVPSTVTIPAGNSSVSVPVTGVAPGVTTITASTANIAATTATVTVSATNTIQVPQLIVTSLGKYVPFTITLPTPAGPNGVTVTITSPDLKKVIPQQNTVFVAAGQTQPASQPTLLAENVGDVNITATAPGYTAGVGMVRVGAKITWETAAVTIPAGTSQIVRFMLDSPAPGVAPFPGDTGVKINFVSSNGSVVFTRPDVTAYPDGSEFTTIAVMMNAVSPGVATITASGINIDPIVLTVTVPGAGGNSGSISLPTGTNVAVGATANFPVTLSTPAPAGGATVSLVSNDTSKATISPASVYVAAGATQPTVQPSVTGVAAGTANITASAPNYTSATQAVTVTSSGTVTLTPANLSMLIGTTQNLTVTLPVAAGAGGKTVTLTSSNPGAATVPSSVTVAQGATTATVPVTSVAAGQTTITAASAGQGQATSSVTVTASIGINLPSNFVVAPGQTKTFTVTLASAPSVATTVNLVSADTAKMSISPATITFNAGSTTPTAQPTVTGIADGTVAVDASGNGLTSATTNVKVGFTLALSPSSLAIVGTATQNLTLTLSSQAQSALTVNLSSSSTATATVPSTVTIPTGGTSVTVPVTGVAPGTTTITASTANIAATTASVTVSATNTISVPALIVTSLGKTVPFTVSLPTPAGPNGVTITISSPDLKKVIPQQATAFVPAGQTTPTSQPTILAENVGDVNVTASAPGYSNGVGLVKIGAKITWETSAVTIPAGTSQIVRFMLDSPAPGVAPFPGDTGVKINFVSSNGAVVFTRPDVTAYPDGSEFTTIALMLNAVSPGVATITASGINIDPIVLTVTVPGAGGNTGSISLPSGTNVAVGGTANFPVTLSAPAPTGGTTVTLVSNDTSKATISPASVTIAAGATQPTTQPTVTGVAVGTANITASAANYTSATQAVTVAASASVKLTPANSSIVVNQSGNLTVTLPAAAPAGGKTVTLTSSNTAVATVPASVTVAEGTTTTTVAVTALTAGTTTITATSSGQGQATANVTVTTGGDIVLPQNLIVAPGDFQTFTVTLANPAAAATFVTLAVSDPSLATLSQTNIFINAGQTAPTVQPKLNGVAAGTVTITATATGLATATTTARVGYGLSFSPNHVDVIGTGTKSMTLILTHSTASNMQVSLTSSNPAVATVPATVTIFAGATSANVVVTGVTPGDAVITATAANIPDATGTVTVAAPGVIQLSPVSFNLGQTGTLPITITTPAPFGGLTLTLTSSQPSRVTVPATVTIPAGATAPTSPVVVNGINVGPLDDYSDGSDLCDRHDGSQRERHGDLDDDRSEHQRRWFPDVAIAAVGFGSLAGGRWHSGDADVVEPGGGPGAEHRELLPGRQ